MRKIFASAGLVALGAASLQAAYAPGLSPTDTAKPWSISATLRGFYDDNYTTAPSGPNKRSSFGFEVRPAAGLNFSTDQTYIGLRYVYDGKFYENRQSDHWDHTHEFNAALSHTFTERYSVDLSDTFVIAQEPDLIDPTGAPFRTDGNNIRNRGAINFNAQLTTLLSLVLGYSNTLIDYEQDAGDVSGLADSRSGLLDRMEHLASINLRWQVGRQTVAFLGYQYGMVDYLSSETIANYTVNPVPADFRNSRSHYVYIGADHSFRPDLTGSVKAGGQFVDFYKDSSADTIISPYAEGSLTYNYTTGSFVQIGARHARNATDVTVLDQESTSVWAQINHAITPKLTGSLIGRFQHSVNNGSLNNGLNDPFTDLDGTADTFYVVGLNLSYRFNQYLAAEAGYNYDRLISDIPGRTFNRNRAYVGVTANY